VDAGLSNAELAGEWLGNKRKVMSQAVCICKWEVTIVGGKDERSIEEAGPRHRGQVGTYVDWRLSVVWVAS